MSIQRHANIENETTACALQFDTGPTDLLGPSVDANSQIASFDEVESSVAESQGDLQRVWTSGGMYLPTTTYLYYL